MRTKSIISLHLVFWIIKNGLELILFSLPYLKIEPPLVFWRNTLLIWVCYFAYFYINYLWLIPSYLAQKRFLSYILWLTIFSIVFCMTLSLIWNGYDTSYLIPSGDLIPRLAFCSTLILFGSSALRFLESWIESESTKEMLTKEVKETELLYLKSQMSPHFLFNTFNNIYGLAINKSSQTGPALGQLKQMMLYVQNFKEGARIDIQEEINTLRSFIALNALRYDCHVHFETQIESIVPIEPMILLPFVENAFKHGDTRDCSTIQITLASCTSGIDFRVFNKIDHYKRKDETGGIGIQNVKRRLDLIYGNSWSMHTTITDESYALHLSIHAS